MSASDRSLRGVRWDEVGAALYVIGLFVLLIFAASGAGLGRTPLIRFLWLVFAVLSAFLLCVRANRWPRVLPGILLYSTLNSTRAISSGHVSGDPATAISRSSAVESSLALAAITLSSFAFYKTELNKVHRIALFIFILSLAWAIHSGPATYVGLGIAFLTSLTVWIYDHLHKLHGRRNSAREMR
ncbi:MAG TPA: hypothetical protein VEJ46_09990 [Candidatus Acidoferrum sp.]|nr:hypothetical protein [Candidatus Acidoferrum sp.]